MHESPADQPVALAHASLDPAAARTLAALLDCLIPADDLGPGATEAGALAFIDSELAGSLRAKRGLYADGLRRLDEYATAAAGSEFAALDPARQAELLKEIEALSPGGGQGALKVFFEQALGDCIDGFLADPVYGGNVDEAGWKLVGYPGPSLTWTEAEQQLDVVVPRRGSSVANLRERERERKGRGDV
ncbi:MAG: gluconate 2-dehydrogenase subunit 3 family protein [Solirubrobacterales bacterium]